jgi:acetyltransferase
VETLAHARPVAGERLTILGNGAGPGVMAADALLAGQGQLAVPSAETVQRLDAVLPAGWSGANPLDILADATVEHYRQSLEQALVDPQADAVLMIHAPSAFVASTEVAQALAPMARQTSRTLLSCWLGGAALAPARAIFADASVPVYDTPEEAVRGFMQLVQYRRNQALLMQVPPSVPVDFTPDRASARAVVQDALNAGRNLLTAAESNAVLAAYRIAVADTCLAASVDEVVAASEKMGFPVALKIVSPDIAHKGEVGGVALDLDSPEAVRVAALAMQSRLLAWRPDARLQGFSIQVMTRRPAALELRAGIRIDPVFGPVLRFGQGGGAADLPHDHALALPPLNMPLARDLVARTRVSALLAGSSERPAVDEDAICRMLIQLAHLAADLPELTDLDINPFLADSDGIIVLDARIRIAEAAGGEHLAIRPYPKELEQAIDWHDGELLLRPIRPEDARPYATFFDALDRKDVRYRMFIGMRELQPSQLARMTQIDYDRELAFLAIRPLADGTHEILAEARVVFDPDNQEAEFALIVRSDLKDRGLGEIMMKKLIGCCRQRGTVRIAGEAMSDNQRMLKLARRLGFTVARLDDPSTMSMRLELTTSM